MFDKFLNKCKIISTFKKSQNNWKQFENYQFKNKGLSVYDDSCLSTYLVDQIMTKSGL